MQFQQLELVVVGTLINHLVLVVIRKNLAADERCDVVVRSSSRVLSPLPGRATGDSHLNVSSYTSI